MRLPDGLEFEWDEENTRHLTAHKVTRAEFEQAMHNGPADLDYDLIDNEDRYRAVGITNAGRFLLLVWTPRKGKVRAVTEFTAAAPARNTFLEQSR